MAYPASGDARVAQQLTTFSQVVNRLGPVALALHDAGLRLTSVEFDGVVDGSNVRENWMERELQRERYGQWRVCRAEDWFEPVGYASDRLQTEITALGLSRLDLTDPNRSDRLDDVIASTRWGQPFLRERLLWSRSSEMSDLVRREKEREAAALGMAPADELDARMIRSRVKRMFKSLGYEPVQAMRPEGMFFRRRDGNVLVCCVLSALSGWGTNIKVSICPALCLRGASEALRLGFERTHFFEMSEALVKGFSRYRGGGGAGSVQLMLYAYTQFLQHVLPLVEEAAADAIDHSA